ncbi:MAG: SMP-30/gluconolactonase/LRE family protein [Sphingomonadaceae bacterium]|nr:SMP-30/gluconolactonase/LRE family protein [Sphingomonadaceae bacterium]
MSGVANFVSGLRFPEAPRWHQDALWFVDYFQNAVFRADAAGKLTRIAEIAGTPGGLGFLPDGTPLVVSQREFMLYAIRPDGTLARHADLSTYARGAANELLVDHQGRAYVGHHGFDFFGKAAPQPSSLILVDEAGKVEEAADGLVFPNGTALTADGRTLIVAESFANRLTAFDVADDGRLSRKREWAALGDHTPDGICLDESGAVWLGSPVTGLFVRVAEGGMVLDTIEAGSGRWAVACALGGPDARTLYCLSAETTPETMPQGRSKGFIDTVRVEAAGAGLP